MDEKALKSNAFWDKVGLIACLVHLFIEFESFVRLVGLIACLVHLFIEFELTNLSLLYVRERVLVNWDQYCTRRTN